MLPRTLKSLWSVYACATALLVAACTQPRDYTPKEAEDVAGPVLREYAAREAVPLDKFMHKGTKYNREIEAWEIYFESATTPSHEVNILVDRYGNAELGRHVKQ